MKLSTRLSSEKAAEISQQQYFESLKHLTTLNAGSILLIAGFVDKLFPNPVIPFLLSTVCAVMLMFWQALIAEEHLGELSDSGAAAYTALIVVTFWAFLGGIVSVGVFALKNLY